MDGRSILTASDRCKGEIFFQFSECPGSKSNGCLSLSSRGIARHQFPQGMHYKEAFVGEWDHNVLIFALRWSFLSGCGMLFRIVPSISIESCYLTTGSVCSGNWLAPGTTLLQLHCMGEALSKLLALSLVTCGWDRHILCVPFTALHFSENIFILECSQLFFQLWPKCLWHESNVEKLCLATNFKS